MIISFNISELVKVKYFLSKITKFNTNILCNQISNCNLGGDNKKLNNYYLFLLNSNNSLTHSIDDIYDYCWEYVAEPKTNYKGNQIITIDKAIEKYIIDNRKLDITKFKTVKSVEDELFIKFEDHPINFFNKLIRNTCILDGKNSGFWLPVVNITNKNISIDSQTITIDNLIYYIEEPKPEDIIHIDNLFNMNNDVGACSAHAGLFACESLEQAYHISKYFKYELFVAMYGNSPFINKYSKKS